jgi:hypothetical protein
MAGDHEPPDPGVNDSDTELDAMTRWVAGRLGPEVPVHFTAFHPDFKMLDRPPTPPATLPRARRIALDNGIRCAYTGNVHDPAGQSTRCHACGEVVIERDWYRLGAWRLTGGGRCLSCGTRCPGYLTVPRGPGGPGGCRYGWLLPPAPGRTEHHRRHLDLATRGRRQRLERASGGHWRASMRRNTRSVAAQAATLATS